MDDKVCIVTGCDRGIGREIALGLAKQHYLVIMACIDVLMAEKTRTELINESKNSRIEIMYIDLGNIHSVNDFCDEVKKKYEKVDILVNNAAVMSNTFVKTIDDYESMFQINYLSGFHLTTKLLPLLSRSYDGRVINVSSKNYKFGKTFFENIIKKYDISESSETLRDAVLDYCKRNFSTVKTYACSKYLYIIFSAELAKKTRKWGYNYLSVVSVDTGVAKTCLADDVHHSWKGGISKLYMTINGTTPEKAAETPLFYALEPNISRFNGRFCTSPNVSKDFYATPLRKIQGEILWNLSTKLLS